MKKAFTTHFKQIEDYKLKNTREYARDFILDILSSPNELSLFKNSLNKPRIQFLYIHHVFDDELEKFNKLLQVLSQNHTFISYSEAVNKILKNDIDAPYICISSDDGFKNNLKAAKILYRYDIKACFFINPDSVGLSDFSKIKEFCNNKLNFPPTEFMNWSDINELLKNGHEIGSHTMGHINIANTNIDQVEENLKISYDILSVKCGKVSHFAFPYGRFFHFNKSAFDLVFKTGFTSCASAERGCHVPLKNKIDKKELLIRRDHVICHWNLNHIMYFLFKNTVSSYKKSNLNLLK